MIRYTRDMRKAKIALVAILASLVSLVAAAGVAGAVTLGGGGDDDGGYSAPSPSPSPNAAPSSSVQSGSSSNSISGDSSSIPGVPASFVACVAWRESGNGKYSSNVYGIIPASGYNGYALNLAGQKAAFAALYARYGTAPWAPYDGC